MKKFKGMRVFRMRFFANDVFNRRLKNVDGARVTYITLLVMQGVVKCMVEYNYLIWHFFIVIDEWVC